MTDQPKKVFKRRTTFFIIPYFQAKFIAWMIVMNIGVCSAFYVAQLYFFWTCLTFGKQSGFGENHIYIQTLNFQKRAMHHMFIGTILLMTAVSILLSLFYSHRIAGPLYHLKKYLKGKTEGQSKERLKFRKGDFFHELADVTNEYFDYEKSQKTGTA
jgi:hypothetical protein